MSGSGVYITSNFPRRLAPLFRFRKFPFNIKDIEYKTRLGRHALNFTVTFYSNFLYVIKFYISVYSCFSSCV